jgi:sigma-B regulation protein RsbU (phosphoserine phosphatase)
LVERLEAGGIPIGIFPQSPYQVGTAKLEDGDWLVIFTDGIVEAENSNYDEYGEPELIRLIDRSAALTPAEMLRAMLTDLDRFVGNTPQHDDMTCLLLKKG